MKLFLEKNKRSYLYLFLYASFIYASLPFAPYIWKSIYKKIGEFTAIIPFIFLLIIALAILSYLMLHKKERNWLTYLMLIVIGLAFAMGMMLVALPSEKLHFLEYGGVGYLSLRIHDGKKRQYLLALPWIFLIGLLDEIIQYLLPNRFFQIQDVLINVAGGILGLLLIRYVIRTKATRAC